MRDFSFSSCGAALMSSSESFNDEPPSYSFKELSDFEAYLKANTTPDAQLAAMSDAQLAALLAEQFTESLSDDKQWHVQDDFSLPLEADTTPDAQLATMSDAQLAALLAEHFTESPSDDEQWHVQDDLPLLLEVDTTPDTQLAAMSDAQLAALLDEQLAQTLLDDEQWHVPDDMPPLLEAEPQQDFFSIWQSLTSSALITSTSVDSGVPVVRNVFLSSDGGACATRTFFLCDSAELPDVRFKITSLSTLAKVEALALVGARLFKDVTVRRSTYGPSGEHERPVSWGKFILPDLLADGAPASRDAYGRKHVIPQWFGHSPDEEFLERLQLRMALVRCHAVVCASESDIRQAARTYLRTMTKLYRSSHYNKTKRTYQLSNRHRIPQAWVHKDDPSAAFRDCDVLDNRPRIHCEPRQAIQIIPLECCGIKLLVARSWRVVPLC
ncbi:hypothetical protein FIBSPDRAFT_901515 [Athelia psychrophila]|uniref:Uncharacterized protein n=1 Tax=Athelia psychrophila TaxID=1759441 RepID=A0A165X2R6_9AGAM|nr:hypothetical protein FIBSPDRAFT_901515 [Fibularhizoctonia sp. CBS 109695]